MKRERPSGWTPEARDREARRMEAAALIAKRAAYVAEREKVAAEIRREHAQAFAAPLIADDLLTPMERRAIRVSVINVQRWHRPT